MVFAAASAFGSDFAFAEVVFAVEEVIQTAEVAVVAVAAVVVALLLPPAFLFPKIFFVLILSILTPSSVLSAEIFADNSSSTVETLFSKLPDTEKNTVKAISADEISIVINLEKPFFM